MNAFRLGLIAGAAALAAASVFAQFGMGTGSALQTPEAMSIEERRVALERCDGMPLGPAKDRCMDDVMVNRNAATQAAEHRAASRVGDGRTGAPGIGVGPSAVRPEPDAPSGRGAGTAP